MNFIRRNFADRRKNFVGSAILILFGCLSAISLSAQNLPDKIRGYKVYKDKISVKNYSDPQSRTNDAETLVKIGDPKLSGVSLTGITLEIPAEISPLPENGKVDFLTFYNFRINDLPVEIEEYRESFSFVKNQSLKLAEPLEIFVGAAQAMRGAFREIKESKDEWQVTGRVFVFGRFKKFGLTFKRVVPVEINLKIKNPLWK